MLAELAGQIERITYTNEESGFTIAQVRVPGRAHLVTVVGNLMAPAAGEMLQMRGRWDHHPKYGEQFKVAEFTSEVPATVEGIRKYLGSGLIRGLGPVMAARIVERFGRETLAIIENDSERLNEVEGIGPKRVAQVRAAWQEQREIRDLMLFLQSHGIGAGYAVKIFKTYGRRAVAVVQRNPYRLATDIFGIGFQTADTIATKLGFEAAAPMRIDAGLVYVLQQSAETGHVYCPYEELLEKSSQILAVSPEAVAGGVGRLTLEHKIVIEDLNEGGVAFRPNHKAVYLTSLHVCETTIARRLKALLAAERGLRSVDADRALLWVQQRLAITLAAGQADALRLALNSKVAVVTGGPGTGKTTIINALLKIIARMGARVLLAAPTGRAAKRMAEATGHEARTLHRLLEFSPARGGFQRNGDRPLELDLLVVDETSMVDTVLMHHLLKALPDSAGLVLVGDVDQLPSVGPGSVLADIIGSGVVPVAALTEIFRQAASSRIIVNAHRINQGRMPELSREGVEAASDFFFVEQEAPEKVLEIITTLVRERIPRRFGFDAVAEVQVLTPMHRGIVGAENLNRTLQQALNPSGPGLSRGSRFFRVGDKVMQVRNNYTKEVFNGDIGRVGEVSPLQRGLSAIFDGRRVDFEFDELDEIVPAYAVSVHKSQGSEFPAVVLPVLTQHYVLLQRNLLYTAVTRGKRLVVLVGTRKALAIAVHNDKTQRRYTDLRGRLAALRHELAGGPRQS